MWQGTETKMQLHQELATRRRLFKVSFLFHERVKANAKGGGQASGMVVIQGSPSGRGTSTNLEKKYSLVATISDSTKGLTYVSDIVLKGFVITRALCLATRAESRNLSK